MTAAAAVRDELACPRGCGEPEWVQEMPPAHRAAIGPVPCVHTTLGPQVCRWVEAHARLAGGDFHGRRPVLRPFQRALLWRIYRIYPQGHPLAGRRVVERMLYGTAKGSGKGPLASWIGDIELGGPCLCAGFGERGLPVAVRRRNPDVVVMATSWAQADLVYAESALTWESGRLAPLAEVLRGEIRLRGLPGTLRRTAATKAGNDGALPSCLLADEVHEYTTEGRIGAFSILHKGTEKVSQSLTVMISTAGFDLDTLLGEWWAQGEAIRKGEAPADPAYLFVWFCAPEGLDPTSPSDVLTGIVAANPLYAYDVERTERRVKEFLKAPIWEAIRYWWNRWTRTAESWLPVGAWEACSGAVELDLTAPTYVGVDMAKRHDTCAVVVVQRTADYRYPATCKVFRAEGGWVDPERAKAYVRDVIATHNVVKVAADPSWFPSIVTWAAEWPELVVEVPQNSTQMSRGYASTREAIVTRRLVHGGDPEFSEQVVNAAPVITDSGYKLRKGRAKTKIDAAVGLGIAMLHAYQEAPAEENYSWTAF
jgi:phage terminase large subunit-like protein